MHIINVQLAELLHFILGSSYVKEH